MTPVAPLDPWMTAWPALPAAILALIGLWGLRRHVRPGWGEAAVLAVALVVRVAWLPLELHEFDGHEAEYRDILTGVRPLSQGGTMLYPAMQWLYRGLGVIWPEPRLLLAFSVVAGLVAIGAVMGVAGRLADRRAALAAGLALALWGNHAFWSVSAYNVILPHAMSWVALWGLAVLFRGGPPGYAGLLAGGAAALAVATRVESALLAPIGLALLALYRPRGVLRWAPGLAAGAVLGAFAAYYVLYSGPPPGAEQRALAWSINQGLVVYFAPFDQPWTWPGLALGLGLGLWRWPKLVAPMLALAVGSHLAFATFEDYGFRHLLNAEAALAVGLGALTVSRVGWPFLGISLVALTLHTADVADRFYASEERFAEALDPDLPVLSVDAVGDCALICEDFRVVPEDRQRSHFNLLDPAEAERMRAESGCIRWLVGVQDHRWSSRAVRDRALRLERLYSVTPRAVVKGGERGYVGLVLDIGARRRIHPLLPTETE
ncbi:MAG: hypothetical protein H6739_23870 [Alphaproteobacteria bacterium]|nr:hypothetical protein [Alphaproteobacteria bacterium]